MALRATGSLLMRTVQPTGRRTFASGPFKAIVNRPNHVLQRQEIFKSTKPTYLKGPGDGMVVAAGFGMLTLALLRLAAGYGDMAYGVNKLEIQ